tara:strand:+ start:7 stop:237 length:231 start_codon:yes stop_codon:yes gene_type:complete
MLSYYNKRTIIITNKGKNKMKYKKRSNNIYNDYEYYVSKENLFEIAFFNWFPTNKQRNKLNYIWKTLLKQHKETIK